ncbi:uncharacterized protein [Narcine bancroftii]|uniref:uncharacterized protein isoform X3 n=1 Tax=Narcine bancroftii TaxID=1343680 RepID=UPI0038312A93
MTEGDLEEWGVPEFADDAKLNGKANCAEVTERFSSWTRVWQMEYNVDYQHAVIFKKKLIWLIGASKKNLSMSSEISQQYRRNITHALLDGQCRGPVPLGIDTYHVEESAHFKFPFVCYSVGTCCLSSAVDVTIVHLCDCAMRMTKIKKDDVKDHRDKRATSTGSGISQLFILDSAIAVSHNFIQTTATSKAKPRHSAG